LGIDLDFAGEGMGADVKAAEGGFTGLDIQASFGPGLSDQLKDFVVGVLSAERDDAVAVFGREGVEYGFGLHTGCSFFVREAGEGGPRRSI
jgi:hypothetical protein